MKKIIVPAIIATDNEQLNSMIRSVKDHCGLIQLDIMDGEFVPNRSCDFEMHLEADRSLFEAHLMVSRPGEWVDRMRDRVGTLIVHAEACSDIPGIVKKIKGYGRKAAVALNPETPVEAIEAILPQLDQVLVMTVNPGFYGSPFVPETIEKIERLRKLAPEKDIEVDGSINTETIGMVARAGANMFCSGSFILKSGDPGKAVSDLMTAIQPVG